MYEIFEKLCKINGVNANQVSKATGISTATLTNWKKGNYTPKTDKLNKIANYFNVSLEYLTTGKTEESTELTEAIQKYHTLTPKKQKHVIELIDLLSEKK